MGNRIELDEYYLVTKKRPKESASNHIDYYCGMRSQSDYTSIKLDDKGNLIECKDVNLDSYVVGQVLGKYDLDGNLIEEEGSMVYEGEQHRRLTYKYENPDSAGNWLKRTTFKKGKIFEIEERKIEYY
jgi:hypothetical protein